MPEATEPGQSTQTEQIASTPAIERDQPTTVKTPATAGKSEKSGPVGDKSLMDLLDIPPEVQQRVAPKAEEKPEEQPELPTEERPEGRPSPEEDEEPEELQAGEEEAGEETPAAEESGSSRVDKRQKRINRLTRKKAELETQLDQVAAENYKLREALQKNNGQGQAQPPEQLIGGSLPAIQKAIATCDATLEWCDNNAEGGEIGEGDKATYYDPKTIRAWRRDAEIKRQKLVVVEEKESDRLAAIRTQADQEAYAICPAMFDTTKPEYQEAVSYVQTYPFIRAIPEATRALAFLIEGRKSLDAKAAAGKNGAPKKQHRDIDERVFSTPRVPIAPHTAEPPTRESKPSSQKRYNEAMSRLINDPDGGVENLAAALAAREAATRQTPSPRSPVRS